MLTVSIWHDVNRAEAIPHRLRAKADSQKVKETAPI